MDDTEKDLREGESPCEGVSPPGEEKREEARGEADVARELEEAKRRLAYLAAEFDNYKKRAAREKEALIAFGNERLLRAILPFLDNLERAMSQSKGHRSHGGLLEGVRLTYDHLFGELKKFGLERISAEGETFDPNLHEAIAQVEAPGTPPGTILHEARGGYLLQGRLLRPAQVTVARESPARDDGAGGEPEPEAGGPEE